MRSTPHRTCPNSPRPAAARGFPGAWLAFLLALLLAPPVSPAEETAPAAPIAPHDFSRPVVVGASRSSFPYSSYDHEGAAQGFAVEITDAVARAMDLRVRRVPIDSNDTARLLAGGDIDVAQFWTETPTRNTVADFSVPALLLQTVVVVRKDDDRIHALLDLRGRTVAVVAAGSVADTFLREQVPGAKILHTASSNQVLGMVAGRECDAAVLSRLTALALIEQQGWKNLRVLEQRVDGYDVRYCFAVRKGDAVLLARLNEGLAIIHRTGEYERIYDRWFGRHEHRRFTREQVVTYVAAALALALAVAFWAFLRQRGMARRIAAQAGELRQQRSLRDALFENHPLATFVLEAGADGRPPRLLSLNREAGRLCGLDPATSAGLAIDALSLTAEIRGYFDQLVGRWPQTAALEHHENYLRDSQRLLDTTLVPLAPGAEGPARLCLLAHDVTKRRLADREVAQSRRLRALGELTGGIAHEFNNLLTPVLLQAEALRAGRERDAELLGGLDLIRDASRRAGELTRRLLAFGRRPEERAESADFAAAIESSVALLRPTFDRRIEWKMTLPPALPPAGCHPTDLHQIVFNLLLNARDTLLEKLARPPPPEWTPRLTVHLAALAAHSHLTRRTPPAGATLQGWLRLTVEDNGLGISPENLERIFEPFFTTKETGRGTGLGLATVWHAVQEAGGFLEVDSRIGEGSRFFVTLPAWASAAAPAPAAAAVPREIPAEPRTPLRILLVEDEELVARASRALLQRLGHQVTHAADGLAAWEIFQARPADYEVVLADLNMPGLNGLDLIGRIRAAGHAIRVVAMSGRVSETDLRALEKLRVDRIVAKPFTLEEVQAALHATAAEAGAPRG